MTSQPTDTAAQIQAAEEPAKKRQSRWRRRLGVLAVLLVIAFGAAAFFGVDVIGWIRDIVNDIRSVPPRYIALVCALKAAESILTTFSWRNILRAAFPDERITFRFVLGAYQGGVGINTITPANAGTLMMLGLYRLRIPGASTPAILSAAVVQNLAFAGIALVTWIILLLTNPDAVDATINAVERVGSLVSDHPRTLEVLAIILGIGLLVGGWWLWRRVKTFWQQAQQGGAILRTPRRYLTHVALPQVLSYGCRIGTTMILMAAFDIPVMVRTVFLVIGSNTIAEGIQVTPGGIGTTESVLVVALRGFADAGSVTAFSLAKTSILTIWNLVFGIFALMAAFGIRGAGRVFRRRDQIAAEAQTADTAD